jgi:MSHA biogenesis protein MshO
MHPIFKSSSIKLPSDKSKGFTLVEMVVVITIVGILAAGAALFIRNPTQAFIDSENRANLTDRADTALRRMARDIRNALPNSVPTTNGLDSFIEFVPVKSAGRYRAAYGKPADTNNPLDFTLSADSFDVLGPGVTVAASDKLVIYNLGIPGSDVYDENNIIDGSNVHPLLSIGNNLSTLSYNGGAFPQGSPSSRFFIVSTPVSYACDMTNHVLLMYSGYATKAAQPASVSALNGLATARVLATNLSKCQVNYVAGVLQRSGVITIYLGFTQDVATVTLMHQVNVVNSP